MRVRVGFWKLRARRRTMTGGGQPTRVHGGTHTGSCNWLPPRNLHAPRTYWAKVGRARRVPGPMASGSWQREVVDFQRLPRDWHTNPADTGTCKEYITE